MCEGCQLEGPTHFLVLDWSVGAFVRRMPRHIEGDFCRRCVTERVFHLLGASLFGPFGIISALLTAAYVPLALLQLTRARRELPRPATSPRRWRAFVEGLRDAGRDFNACFSGGSGAAPRRPLPRAPSNPPRTR